MGVSYIPVARVGELTPGAMKEVDLGGRQVLVAFVEGKYLCVLAPMSPRRGGFEGGGQLVKSIMARKSAATIIATASILKPANARLPKGGAPLTVLPAEERGEEVCIRLEW